MKETKIEHHGNEEEYQGNGQGNGKGDVTRDV
jgi:hypothetical protein